MGNVKTYNPWQGGKNEGKSLFDVSCFILPLYEADITHTSWQMHVAIKAHSKMKCTNIQGHKNKLRTWEKSVTRDCEPECSAVQHSSWREGQRSMSKWQQRFWKTKGELGGKKGATSQQRKEAVTTTGSMQPPRVVWHTERENKERLGGRVLPQEQAAPNQAGSTQMNGKQQCV